MEITVACSNCGKSGHTNKRGCPKPIGYKDMIAKRLITSDVDEEDNDSSSSYDSLPHNTRTKQQRRCSNCGKIGNNKWVCPNPQWEENNDTKDNNNDTSSSESSSEKKPAAKPKKHNLVLVKMKVLTIDCDL